MSTNKNKVYVYKEYNDEYAYGEELIKVFSTKEKALECLKKEVFGWASDKFGENIKSIDSLKEVLESEGYSLDDCSIYEDYMSIYDGDCTLFFIVEECPVEDAV